MMETDNKLTRKKVISQQNGNAIGLYIHIPFCKQKCLYCDFCSGAFSESKMESYVDALIAEASGYSSEGTLAVNTVFFGGGTPSILPIALFEKIVVALKNIFLFSDDIEFTIEANPKTLTREKVKRYKELGVNRISIGLQSIHDNELKKLGRIHTFDDFLCSYNLAKDSGITNINVDLMYGIPDQTEESFKQTLSKVIGLSPSHISCYGLIVEPNTPFYSMADSLNLPDEDAERDMYDLACSAFSEAGYDHYEISNYSRPELNCRHNMKYWNDEEYIGLGISAHSYFKGKRYYNSSDFDEYFSFDELKYRYNENDTVGIDKKEYIMLRLRLRNGIIFKEYSDLFGEEFEEGNESYIQSLVSQGFAFVDERSFRLTEKGFYLSNAIISSLAQFG